MGKKKRLIIPIFIPFEGCAHQCVFCNQQKITGRASAPSSTEIKKTVETYLSTWRGCGQREAAFYGGSFTALPESVQTGYLESVAGFVTDGRLDGVRVSTRPDCIWEPTPGFLRSRHVRTVELGAQSMIDEILKLSGRGHTERDTVRAVKVLKDGGLKVGLQLMPGLPGDTVETVLESTRTAVSLAPDFIRIYPTLVVKDTPLERMYLTGGYEPWALDRMLEVTVRMLRLFSEAGIPVIRIGLPHSGDFYRDVVAGPYHPGFGGLVRAALGRTQPSDRPRRQLHAP
jgi:histone acetyltransferase (RNA polymerase elongator complex component)